MNCSPSYRPTVCRASLPTHAWVVYWSMLPIWFAAPVLFAADASTVDQAIAEYSAAMEAKDRDQRLQKFARAEQLFRQSMEATGVNPSLLVNLGNAALQAEHVGTAIVSFRRALELDPQHEQAGQNLLHARSVLPEWVRPDESHGLMSTLFFWQSMFSRPTLFVFFGFCFLTATTLFAVGLLRRSSLVRTIALAVFAFWFVLVAADWISSDETSATDAVVVMDEVILFSADSENSPRRLSEPVPDGAEVRILQQRDRWLEVEIAGKSGWLLTSNIERIASQ